MSLERVVRDSLQEHVGQTAPPPFDREAVRRSGQRQLRRRRVWTTLAVAASVAVVATIAVQVGDDTSRSDDAPVAPAVVHAPVGGLRAFLTYDPADEADDLHVGDVAVRPDHIAGSLDTGASTSPYGVFAIGTDGAPYLMTPDGDEVLLGDPTDPDGTGFRASIASDPEQPLAAWSSQSDAGVRLHLYALEAGREVASTDVPCDPDDGCGVEVVATAGGLVFVQTADGTSIWDPDRSDALTPLTGPEARVIDVGGHVVLLDGSDGGGPLPDVSDGPLASGLWRYAWSNAVDDGLSGDGRWLLGYGRGADRTISRLLLNGSTQLVHTIANTTNADFDSDSSVLAVVNHGGGHYWLMDCAPSGGCTDIYRSEVGYEPTLLGNDM